MAFPKSLSSLSSMLLVIALAGCAGELSPEQRARVGAVRVYPPQEPPKATLYSDATSQNASMVGAQFGLIGGLVGGSIAAVSIDKGRKKFANITQPQIPYVASVLRAKMEDGLRRTGRLPLASGPNPSGSVRLDRVQFGVAHAGDQRFTATISGEVQIHEPNGKEVWHRLMIGSSVVDFSLEEAQANAGIFRTAIDEAATRFADSTLAEL